MHIEALEYFREVVEQRSISKVAANSHISQSALSQMIQKIEDNLGYKLLDRSNRGVEPTDMGKVVLKYSDSIIKAYNRMKCEMNDCENHTNTIRISANWSLVTYSLPCVLYKVKKKYTKHKYELVSESRDDIIRDVRNDICDFGVINGEAGATDLLMRRIGSEKAVLVASTEFDVPDSITMEELFNYDLISLSNMPIIQEALEKNLTGSGFSVDNLKVLFNIDSIGAVKSTLQNGYGMSFLPYKAVKREIYQKEFKLIEIEGFDTTYDINVISKKLNDLNRGSRETIDYFTDHGEENFC